MGPREDEGKSSEVVVAAIVRVAAELGSGWDFSRTGGRSVVECLPVVQGGMDRNSSNVRTRGLQHFQPVELSNGAYKVGLKGYHCDGIKLGVSSDVPFCPS